MYTTSIEKIENGFLADAIKVLSLREDKDGNKLFKFKSLFMDLLGECAITFNGRLTINQIKEIMVNTNYPMEDKCIDSITPEYGEDYYYRESESTTIFTPDGLNYNEIWEDIV